MRISVKVDYAVRAMIQLAAEASEEPVKADTIARAQDIPLKFLLGILSDLKRAHLLRSQRGAEGGYWLARAADEITLADVIRAVDGPLAYVRGTRPEALAYGGAAEGQPSLLDRNAMAGGTVSREYPWAIGLAPELGE